MRPVIWPIPGRRALLTGLGALAAGGLLTRRQARAVTISSSGGVTPPFRRNLLRRNGGFEVWQRGAGPTADIAVAASTVAYTTDGWYLASGPNQGSRVFVQPGLVSGSQYSAAIIRNVGQTGVGVYQFGFPLDTDELYPALGQFVALSFTVQAGVNFSPAGGSIAVRVFAGTGTPIKRVLGFTGESQVISSTASLTTTATRFTFTSAAVVPLNTRQMEVTILWTPVGTAGANDGLLIDTVKLEVVPDAFGQATEYERYLFEEELMLCQRHYFKTFPYATAPAQATAALGAMQGIAGKAGASSEQMILQYPVLMRNTPTVVTYNAATASAEVRDATATVDCTGTTAAPSTSNVRVAAVGNAATAVGNLLSVHLTADAGI